MTIISRRAAVLALALAGAAAAQNPGTVTSVRVYRGQALVTRTLAFTAVKGAQDLVVADLPERVLPDSLYATGDDRLRVRAVRYRAEAVRDEPRPELRDLDQQIAAKEDELAQIDGEGEVLQKHLAYLDKLEAFVAPTATAELSKGVLNPEALIQVTEFTHKQRGEAAAKLLELGRREKTVREELSVLTRKRQALAPGKASTSRQAVLFLDATEAGAASIELSYLVGGVTWDPAYIARLSGQRDKLVLEYHAVVTQASGEPWDNVDMVLSTGFPTMQADSPILAPLYVRLGTQAEDGRVANAKEYAAQRSEIEQQIRGDKQAERQMGAPGKPAARPAAGAPVALPTQAAPDLTTANVLAARLQQLELTASDDAIRGARRAGSASEGLAVDYPLPGKVSLQSRDDQQVFRIAALDLKPSFYYTAVPLLSNFVYRAVEAVNSSQVALLPGTYNAYVDGAFAGQGAIPLTAGGQSMTLGFGTEPRLKATRDLEDKKTELRGGNKQLHYTYRIRPQNFMDQPALVRVWDRLPKAPDDQVAVTLLEPGPPLSDDPLYVSEDKPRGLLRWDVKVAPGAANAEAHTFSYKYQLEFDKNYSLGALPAELEEQMKRDLERMRERR